MFNAAVFAVNACKKTHDCSGVQHTPCLQKTILSYFEEDDNCDVPNKMSESRFVMDFENKWFQSLCLLYTCDMMFSFTWRCYAN